MTRPQTEMEFDQALDARGLNCPLPVLKAKVLLNKLKPGEVLRVKATDPHASIDFEAYCARAGHSILSTDTQDGVITLYIERAPIPGKD